MVLGAMSMMNLRITAEDLVWRGRARVLDEAIAVLRVHWDAEIARHPEATLVLTLTSEPAELERMQADMRKLGGNDAKTDSVVCGRPDAGDRGGAGADGGDRVVDGGDGGPDHVGGNP